MAIALEISHLGKAVKFAGANWHDFFGCTLDDETDVVWAVLQSVSNSHSLAVGAERNPELEDVVTLALNKFLLHADARVEEKIQDTNFDGAATWLVFSVAHLHVGVAVQNGAIPEHVLDLEVAAELIGREGCVNHVDALDSHVTSGQSGGLSSHNFVELTSGLKGTESLDEQVLGLECVNREGHGHGDDQRHSFWDADNEQSDGSRSEVDGARDRGTLDKLVVAAHDEEEPDDTKEDQRDSSDSVCVIADDSSQSFEFALENSHLFLDLQSVLVVLQVVRDLLFLEGVLADGEDEGLAGTTHDDGVLK